MHSAIVGFTLGIGLLVATLGFGSSLQRLLDTPRLYGWTWDVKSGAPALPDIGSLVIPALLADDDVQDAVRRHRHPGRPRTSNGSTRSAVNRVKGTHRPGRDGRPGAPPHRRDPRRAQDPRRRSAADLGDTVTARDRQPRGPRQDRRASGSSHRSATSASSGPGALMTYGQLQELVPAAKQNVFLLKFTPETSVEREFAHMRNALEPLPSRLATRPNDLENLASIGGLQVALVAILATLAAATLAHTLLHVGPAQAQEHRALADHGLRPAPGLSGRPDRAGADARRDRARRRDRVRDHRRSPGLDALRRQPRARGDPAILPWTGLARAGPGGALALAVAVAAIPAWLASRTQAAAALHDQ